jgi:FkbM family methyltransferase
MARGESPARPRIIWRTTPSRRARCRLRLFVFVATRLRDYTFRGKGKLVRIADGCLADLQGRRRDEQHLSVRARDSTERLMFLGEFEREKDRIFASLLSRGDCFVDAGAHIGYHTLTMAHAVGRSGTGHAFEPMQESAAYLRWNLEANDHRHVTLTEIGLGAAPGRAIFHVPQAGGFAGTSRFPIAGSSQIELPLTTIDLHFQQVGGRLPDLIKLDLEGGELDALRGAREVISAARPRIIVELNAELMTRAAWTAADMVGLLRGLGYRSPPSAIGPSGLQQPSRLAGNATVDVLFE